MNELALFAGAGGGLLGSKLLGWKTICAVEWEPYCQNVLLQRQEEGYLDPFPIWDDVRTFDGHPWRGLVDVISAGFPCQPFSQFGDRKAGSDERNQWPATIRIIGEVRPRFALLENVMGLITHPYFGTVLGDLAALGYDAEWGSLGADDAGFSHHRKRVWILAYSQSHGRSGLCQASGFGQPQHQGSGSGGEGGVQNWIAKQLARPDYAGDNTPVLSRTADGLAHRMDRLKSIGNGQVPEVAATAWHLLMNRVAAGKGEVKLS